MSPRSASGKGRVVDYSAAPANMRAKELAAVLLLHMYGIHWYCSHERKGSGLVAAFQIPAPANTVKEPTLYDTALGR